MPRPNTRSKGPVKNIVVPPDLKPIPGFDGYYAREDGHIFSTRGRKLRVLSQNHRKRYLVVTLAKQTKGIHQLVALAFIGPRPAGMETCHNDGDPHNNHASNLRYDTHRANMLDAVQHGRHYRGGPHRAASKLTETQVAEIKRRIAAGGQSQGQIARTFGVDRANITAIVKGKTWKHVTVDVPQRQAA